MENVSVIFDIDGTLIDSYKVSGEVYKQAILEILPGVEIKPLWKDYQNVTDSGIIKEILSDNGLPLGDNVTRIRDCFLPLISQKLSESPCGQIHGAQAFLDECRQRYRTGIATGCWKKSGEIKLHAAGIDWADTYISSSCDFDSREDILLNCLRHLRGEEKRVVYFGDAEWDVKTTDNLGWNFIGIGEKLKGKCEHWFQDYSDQKQILQRISELKF